MIRPRGACHWSSRSGGPVGKNRCLRIPEYKAINQATAAVSLSLFLSLSLSLVNEYVGRMLLLIFVPPLPFLTNQVIFPHG
jgi:hypothetical protein